MFRTFLIVSLFALVLPGYAAHGSKTHSPSKHTSTRLADNHGERHAPAHDEDSDVASDENVTEPAAEEPAESTDSVSEEDASAPMPEEHSDDENDQEHSDHTYEE